VGSISYKTWGEFIEDFMADFCLKNEVQTSRTKLETLRFFQNGRTIDKYIEDFKNSLIELNTSRGHTSCSNFSRDSIPRSRIMWPTSHWVVLWKNPQSNSTMWPFCAMRITSPMGHFEPHQELPNQCRHFHTEGVCFKDPCPVSPHSQPPFHNSYPPSSMLWAHQGQHHLL
jgi:hypothetical protein